MSRPERASTTRIINKTVKMDKTVKIDPSKPAAPPKTPAPTVTPATLVPPGTVTANTTNLGTLLGSTYRNFVSGLTGTTITDWNDSFTYAEVDPLAPDTTDEEIAAANLDDIHDNIDLQSEIARGGQACISRGLDRKFNRVIAVKSLHDELKDKSEHRRAFVTEARVTAQLEHPSIVPVYGMYEDDENGLHLSMKLIRGRTLKEYLDRTRMHYRRLTKVERSRHERALLWKRLGIFLRICEAISYVHHRKVIHRDLKPENIMIGSFNETYVMDWGIAEYHDDEHPREKRVAGTLQYIAPEVINQQDYDTRSDIFLLGLILYEIVFLKPAYPPSTTRDEAIYKAQRCLIDPFQHKFKCKVDLDLKMIIAKALMSNPDKRYQTVKELTDDLAAYEIGEEVSANPDNIVEKILRKLRHHYKFLLFTSITLLLAFAVLSAVAMYREMNHRRLAAQKDHAMSVIYSKGMYSCSRFDRQFRHYEYLLSVIASEAALLSKAENIQNEHARYYTFNDLFSTDTAPPDYGYSPTFMKNISLDHAMFIYPGMAAPPPPQMVKMMQVLYLLKDSLRAAVVNSMGDNIPEGATTAEQNEIIRNQVKPLISWVYVGFGNGLHISYPPRTDVAHNYDPRKRDWYAEAVKTPYHAIWSAPYVDTGELKDIVVSCSQAIVNEKNEVIGVAGADVSLSQLIAILHKTGNQGDYIKNKYLVDKSGRIIADSTEKLLAARTQNDQLEFRQFPYSDLLNEMWGEKNGWRFSSERGINYLYFFLEIESLEWLYIERIDFEELLKNH